MTEKNGSLSLPGFEDRLWGELEQLHAATNEPIHLDRSPLRTRFLAVAAAIVAAVAVAGGAAVALSAGGDDSTTADVATSPDEGGDGEATGPSGDGAAEQTDDGAEVEGPPDAIVYVEQVNVSGHVDHRWTDEATGASRDLMLDVAGNPELDSAWLELVENPDGTVTVKVRVVDHAEGTYADDDWTPPVIPGDTAWPRESWREDALVRGWIAEGSKVEDGLEEVDGQELLRVVDVDPFDGQAAPDQGVTWVDPETYRPVKRLGYPGSDAEYTMTFEYLERTEENLALLQPEIPEGFVEVDPPEDVDVDPDGIRESGELEAQAEGTTTSTTVQDG